MIERRTARGSSRGFRTAALAVTGLLLGAATARAAPVEFDLEGASLNGAPVTGTITIEEQDASLVAWNLSVAAGPDNTGTGSFAALTYSSQTGEGVDIGGDGFQFEEGDRRLFFFPPLAEIVENLPSGTDVSVGEGDLGSQQQRGNNDAFLVPRAQGTPGPSIDSVQACIGPAGFEFDIFVSGTTTTQNIFRIGADDPVFQGAPAERFAVNFDAQGNVSNQPPVVETFGTPANDRWVDGGVADFTITSLGNNLFRLRGTLPPGAQPFAVGDTVRQIAYRTSVRTTTASTTVRACSAQGTPGSIEFAGADLTIDETDTQTPVQLTLNRVGGSSGAVSVTLASVDGTATGGTDPTSADYLELPPQTVSWEDGDAEPRIITLEPPIFDDDEAEPDETFSYVIADPTGGASLGAATTRTVTIVDDDGTGPSAGGDEAADTPPGETVEITFPVDGVFPITLTADGGTLTPTTLTEAGDVVYSRDVPADADVGTALEDVVVLTDANGDQTLKQIALNVVAPQQERDLSSIADLSANQRALARLVDDVCPRLDAQGGDADVADLASVCSRLRDVETSDTQVRDALDAINPEELVVMATSAVRLSLLQHGNLEQRINGLRSGASGIDLAGVDLEIQGQQISGEVVAEVLRGLLGAGASADDPFERWGLFADGKLKWGDRDDTENEAAFDFDVAFVTLGADYRFRPNLIAGGALTWGAIEADFEDGTDFEVESWSGSLFGTWYSESGAYLDALATYGRNDYDSERRIRYNDAVGAIDRIANGETEGDQFSAGLSGGWDWNRGAFTAGPHVGLYYLDLTVDGFTEDGADGLDLAIGEQEATSFTMNAGLHASYVVNLPFGVLIPHVRADSVFEFEDEQQQIEIGFASDPFRNDPTNPSPSVTLSTDRPDDQYYVLSAGASAQFVRGVSAYVNYQYTASMENWAISNLTYGLRFERSF